MLAWLGRGEALFPGSGRLSAPCVHTQPFLGVMHTHGGRGDGGTHDYLLLLFVRAQILPSRTPADSFNLSDLFKPLDVNAVILGAELQHRNFGGIYFSLCQRVLGCVVVVVCLRLGFTRKHM